MQVNMKDYIMPHVPLYNASCSFAFHCSLVPHYFDLADAALRVQARSTPKCTGGLDVLPDRMVRSYSHGPAYLVYVMWLLVG